MPYSVVTSDNFTRANTTAGTVTGPGTYNAPSTGGAYVDYKGSTWYINSNTLVATGLAGSDYTHAYLVRPTSENILNGQVAVTATPGTGGAAMVAVAREQGGYAYECYFYQGVAYLGYGGPAAGNFHNIATFSSLAGITGASPVTITLTAQGASPTALTATISQGATSYTVTANDSTAGLQTAGQWGLAANSAAGASPVFSALTISQYAAPSAAANITISPTSASVTAGNSQIFNVGVDGYLTNGMTLTVTPATTIGTLSPATLTFTGDGVTQPAAKTVTLSTTSSGTGNLTGTHSESGGTQTLADFASVPITVAAAPLAIGSLTATPSNAGVTLALSAALSGGSGSGYSYAIYRGTTANFTANSGSLLATVSSLPYTDGTASVGIEYYYGVLGSDNASHTIAANPSGVGSWSPTYTPYVASQLQTQAINIGFMGDSITAGTGVSNGGTVLSPTMPYFCMTKLKRLLGIRSIYGSNNGVGGTTLTDWAPGGAAYNAAKSSMNTLVSANPTALPLFSLMLGTNDSAQSGTNNSPYSGSLTPTQYSTKLSAIITQLLSDFPSCKVFVHMSPYYSANTHNASNYEQNGLAALFSYRAAIVSTVQAFASSNPGSVYAGDTYAFQYFAQYYQAELQPDTSGPNGTFYLHPLGTAGSDGLIGTQSLGEMHAQSIAQGLYGAVSAGAIIHNTGARGGLR